MKLNSHSAKTVRPLNDFQVFKGRSEETMKPFGSPVMVHHEAWLIIRDDQANGIPGAPAIYAIYRRSEHRILQIIKSRGVIPVQVAA